MTALGKFAAKMEAHELRLRDAAVMALATGLFVVSLILCFGALQ